MNTTLNLNEAWKRGVTPVSPDLAGYTPGLPQRSGALTVVPLFRDDARTFDFAPPREAIALERVHTYGDVELRNRAEDRPTVTPLHMGFIQQGAQNHALCRSALLGAGKTLRFKDACCVQAGQGGYMEGKEQWFFVLPMPLREAALGLAGKSNYSKLWEAISALNREYGLPERGHLEQLLTRQRAYLTQFQSRFELLAGQIGALFFLRERLVGIEIGPSPAYFAEVWMPLVCFAYGVPAYAEERKAEPEAEPVSFAAESVAELRAALLQSRAERDREVASWLAQTLAQTVKVRRERTERDGETALFTVESETLTGQAVLLGPGEGETVAYASLFAKQVWWNKGLK